MVIQIVQKLSLTTGALVPSGIAKFLINYFLNSWRGGGTREVKTVSLLSVNGATVNAMLETLGEVKLRIRFCKIKIIFTGKADVLKSLSLPIILENFFKIISFLCSQDY